MTRDLNRVLGRISRGDHLTRHDCASIAKAAVVLAFIISILASAFTPQVSDTVGWFALLTVIGLLLIAVVYTVLADQRDLWI